MNIEVRRNDKKMNNSKVCVDGKHIEKVISVTFHIDTELRPTCKIKKYITNDDGSIKLNEKKDDCLIQTIEYPVDSFKFE